MKKYFTILLILFVILFTSCGGEKKKVVVEQPKQHKQDTIKTIYAAKIVYILVGKHIDFDKMLIDTVIKTIQREDTVMMVKPLSNEIHLNSQIIKVYRVEDITCPYLKRRFQNYHPSDVVFEYNDKLLVKCKDGIMKVYHIHVDEKLIK
jgi:hypothetical protein